MSPRSAILKLSVALGLALITPSLTSAQEFGIGLGGGYFYFTQASNSTKAVFGSAGGAPFSGDVRIGLHHNLYAAVAVRYLKKDGERVFVANPSGRVFPLRDEPLSARTLPVELTLEYRFESRRSSIVPYIGIGPGFTSYHEESTVGGITTTLDETKFAAHALAGIEFGRGRFRFGVEANYSTVPSAIGVGGVSQIYNETNIGGVTILGRIVFTNSRP